MFDRWSDLASKFVDITPKYVENYYGHLEEFILNRYSASVISHPLQIPVDYLTASIDNKKEKEVSVIFNKDNISVLFNDIAQQMKTIDLRLSAPSTSEQAVFDTLESCVNLQSLIIDVYGYTEFYNSKLLEVLPKLSSLRSLTFKHIQNILVIQQLSKILAENTTIDYLSFKRVLINVALLQSLSTNKSIRTLRIRNSINKISSWKALNKLLGSSTTITAIDIRPINDPRFLTQICSALKTNRSIKTITTDSILFAKQQHFEEFLMAVEQTTCESLTIVKYIRSNATRSALSKFLSTTKTLKYLQLGKCTAESYRFKKYVQPDQEEMDFWAPILQANKTLKAIALNGWSSEKDFSLKSFANAMKSNVTLLTLDLSYTEFGEDALIDIADIITNNKTLTKLNLRGLKSNRWPQLIDALIHNKSLTSVDLSESVEVRTPHQTYVEAITIDLIKRLIEGNSTLRHLKFQAKYRMTQQMFVDLLPSFKHNDSLTSVDLLAPSEHYIPEKSKLGPDLVADVFLTKHTMLNFKTRFSFKHFFEPYITRNRHNRLDAIIMLHNLFKSQILPAEIWRHVFSYIEYYVKLGLI